MILSSIPSIRVWPFWISSGSKLPSFARQSKRSFDETAIARGFNRHRSVIAFQHLAGRAIAPVGLLAGRLTMRFIAQMLGQLSAQHSLHQADLQFRHQACVAQQILGSFKAAQQLVQKFFGNRHCCHAHLVWKHGVKLLIHKRSDTLQIGGNVERMVAPSRACSAYPAVQGSVVALYFWVLRDLIPFSLLKWPTCRCPTLSPSSCSFSVTCGLDRPLVVAMRTASRRNSSVYLLAILNLLHRKHCSKET